MFPHSEIRGSWDICSSPRLFAAYHVFHRLLVPRHPPCALIGLTFLCRPMVLVASFSNKYKSLHSRLLLKITFLGCLVIKQFLFIRILILYAVFKVRLTDRINQSFKTPNSFPLSYAVFTWNPEALFDFFKFWRPPVLPCRLQHSTFGRPALHGRVRDGNGCFLRTYRHQKFLSL